MAQEFFGAEVGLLSALFWSIGTIAIMVNREAKEDTLLVFFRNSKFIRKAQELGFSLTEIRELLVLRRTGSQACSHVRDLLSNALGRVGEKIEDLLRLQGELKGALRKCNRDLKRSGNKPEKSCPVLEELERVTGNQGT